MSVKKGVNPITWANEDVPEPGGATPLGTGLAETSQAGYTGAELGAIVSARGLEPMAARHDGRILENTVDQGGDATVSHPAPLRDPRRPPCTLAELKSKILSGDIVLTAILEKAARSAFAAPDFIAFETRTAFATRTGVPPQTVDRLVRRLGFKRFRDFRAVFRAHLSQIAGKAL